MKCKVEGCNRDQVAKNLCKRHYTQMKRYGEILPNAQERDRFNNSNLCKAEDCNSKVLAKGYCRKHYMQVWRNGEIQMNDKVKSIYKKHEAKFVLVDLERTMASNTKIYWKASRRGYTPELLNAGIYNYNEAIRLSKEDLDNNTVILPLTFEMYERMEESKANIKLYE